MPKSSVLALDVGEKRVGMALARAGLRVPVELGTLERPAEAFWQKLLETCQQYDVGQVVIGLPRGLEGQDTAQTVATRSFGEEFKSRVNLPVHWQDEALTSVKATEILQASGKKFEKADVDSLAASLILSDYLEAGGV